MNKRTFSFPLEDIIEPEKLTCTPIVNSNNQIFLTDFDTNNISCIIHNVSNSDERSIVNSVLTDPPNNFQGNQITSDGIVINPDANKNEGYAIYGGHSLLVIDTKNRKVKQTINVSGLTSLINGLAISDDGKNLFMVDTIIPPHPVITMDTNSYKLKK